MSKPKTKPASEPKAAPSDRFRSAPYYDPIRGRLMVLTHLGPTPAQPGATLPASITINGMTVPGVIRGKFLP